MPTAPSRSPVVSVALCTYNGAGYLAEQLRSILAQSRRPDEIVLSDDASADDTVGIARAVAAEAGVVLTVLENPSPLGVTANFEQAVRACRGDIVVLSDQDDVWHPTRVARAVDEFDRDPALLLLHGDARLVDASGRPLGSRLFQALEVSRRERSWIHRGHAFRALLRRNLVTGATTAFRRELLADALPFPASWVHDVWLAAIAAATGRVDFVAEPLIDYRQHGGNQIGARALTVREKSATLTATRAQRIAGLQRRSEALAERLEALAVAGRPVGGALAEVRRKLDHLRWRAGLPAARPRRIGPVIAAAARGSYDRYSRGGYDVVRDLLQSNG